MLAIGDVHVLFQDLVLVLVLVLVLFLMISVFLFPVKLFLIILLQFISVNEFYTRLYLGKKLHFPYKKQHTNKRYKNKGAKSVFSIGILHVKARAKQEKRFFLI